MSLKSLLQTILIILIFLILGSIYFRYFSDNIKVNENIVEEKVIEEKVVEKKEEPKTVEEKVVEKKEEPKTVEENKKNKPKNLVNDIEYLTTDTNGNKYKLLATSGKTNSENNDILDLINVRGFITSPIRSTIYIVSDFAQYNSSNLNSKFYENVVINYEDKEIVCDNFDINMETDLAIAYNNVIVTDPKSIMRAGEIIFEMKTKNININPESKISKVKINTE